MSSGCQDCGERIDVGSRGAPTRPSCIVCVEKHLGAAYVLLTECREGYAYRMRAVGHMFEAEDESQEWKELHDAIRDARINYQSAEVMPDWDVLDAMVAVVRSTQN